jgi:hypothetical protein
MSDFKINRIHQKNMYNNYDSYNFSIYNQNRITEPVQVQSQQKQKTILVNSQYEIPKPLIMANNVSKSLQDVDNVDTYFWNHCNYKC